MYEFPFELDDFQKQACEYITEGKSVVVCAPTGAGKTVIAQHAIHLALENGTRVFYTTPLKALSNQKFYDFSEKYGDEKVGLLTGDTSVNRDAQIVVMTTEVFRNMLYGTNLGAVSDNLKNVRYVILDEVHYMNDEQRGTVWEESIIYCPVNIQIIALSATVANADELTGWINTVHSGTELVNTDFRPVPLKYFYFDSSQPTSILPLFTPTGQLNNKIKPERPMFNRGGRSKKQEKSYVKEIVKNLALKDMLPAIYFTFSRKKCDEQAEKCIYLDLVTAEERAKIRQFVDEYIAENPYLYNNKQLEFLYNGVASHHAGLLPSWKNLVEKLFQQGLIKVVFATETLAAGINMPARTTIISSVSKRTDSGHRMLTPSEFLQMSGRAGRRGMDDVGYVVVVGNYFQSPEEVAQLVLSDANPLESRFSPSYSMVLNLLQRFTIDEAKDLIMKSFGYYSTGTRLFPLIQQTEAYKAQLAEREINCPFNKDDKTLIEYLTVKNLYLKNKDTYKKIIRQENAKNRKISAEALKFGQDNKKNLQKMHSFCCDNCKLFKKHSKNIDVIPRIQAHLKKLEKETEHQRDVFWNSFIAHRNALTEVGYLVDDYPTEKGKTTSQLRSENELFLAQIIFSGSLDNLTPSQLAGVLCAVTTEDMHGEFPYLPISEQVRKTLNNIRNIKRKVDKIQKYHRIEAPLFINTYFSSLIELWVEGADWETVIGDTNFAEGDVVRSFKRTIDVLRQLTNIANIPENIVFTAREAIDKIQREPVNLD